MNTPMTFSLFLASALLTTNLSFAQNGAQGDEDQNVALGQSQQQTQQKAQQRARKEQPQEQEAPPIPEGNEGTGDEGQNGFFAVSLQITAGDAESYGEVTLDETSFDNFLVALLVSQSDDTMGIGDNQFLMGARLLALTAGTGSSAGMNLPGGIKGLADELWIQVVLLDDQGHIQAGPVKKLGDAIVDEAGDGA